MNDESDLFVVATLVVIIKDRRILMMKRSPKKQVGPNLWETLSGRLHHEEDPKEGLLREIEEESSLKVRLKDAPFDVYLSRYGERPMLAMVYEAEYLSGEVRLSSEHTEYHWGTLSDFKEKSSLKRLYQALLKLQDKID